MSPSLTLLLGKLIKNIKVIVPAVSMQHKLDLCKFYSQSQLLLLYTDGTERYDF